MIIRESSSRKGYAVTITDTGDRHLAMNMPNQDSSDFYLKDDQFFMTVSDGVGSCKHAAQGSKAACRICRAVFDELTVGNVPWNGKAIVREISNRWKELFPGPNAMEYCATLKAVFAKPGLLIGVSIGDGLLLFADSKQRLMIKESASDFLNETVCLCPSIRDDLFDVREISVFPGRCAVFMSSDGVANALVEDQELLLIEAIRTETGADILVDELGDMFEEICLTNTDDKTLGVVRYDY